MPRYRAQEVRLSVVTVPRKIGKLLVCSVLCRISVWVPLLKQRVVCSMVWLL